jgi:ribosomal protein L23
LISQEKAYDTIMRPIITEKSTMLAEANQIAFVVPMDSNQA